MWHAYEKQVRSQFTFVDLNHILRFFFQNVNSALNFNSSRYIHSMHFLWINSVDGDNGTEDGDEDPFNNYFHFDDEEFDVSFTFEIHVN